jgi:hypothetical protein
MGARTHTTPIWKIYLSQLAEQRNEFDLIVFCVLADDVKYPLELLKNGNGGKGKMWYCFASRAHKTAPHVIPYPRDSQRALN